MATENNVSISVHTHAPLTFGAVSGMESCWFTCPRLTIKAETGRAGEDNLTVFLGSIENAKALADEIYAHCRKQAAAYQAKAEAMAAAGEEEARDA